MGNLFNLDNGFFSFMGKLWDIIFISLIWAIFCLPIITIGPATTALYYVVVKVIRRDRGYILREFFHSFKENFKNGAILGIFLLLLYVILWFDRNYVKGLEGQQYYILFAIFNTFTFLLTCITIYVFPILSRFTMNKKQILKTAFFMSMRHLPSTFLLVAIVGTFAVLVYLIPLLFFIGSGLCYLICSFFLERIFKKYMPQKSEDENDNYKDEWYLE